MLDEKFVTDREAAIETAKQPVLSRQDLQDRVRALRRERNRIQKLYQIDESNWSEEDRKLLEQEGDIIKELEKTQALLWNI